MTLLIIILIAISYALNLGITLVYDNRVDLPLWQIALVTVFVTWILIAYSFSIRLLYRHFAKIHSTVQYYFGWERITEYHIFLLITYLMIIGVGLYWQLYLGDTIVTIACIFIPLIYLTVSNILIKWVSNDYQLLADIEDYNKKARKKHEI